MRVGRGRRQTRSSASQEVEGRGSLVGGDRGGGGAEREEEITRHDEQVVASGDTILDRSDAKAMELTKQAARRIHRSRPQVYQVIYLSGLNTVRARTHTHIHKYIYTHGAQTCAAWPGAYVIKAHMPSAFHIFL